MASTDPFDQQSQQLDANKASMLAAISQYGSQAHQAMQAAQDQLAAQKTAAISAALAEARQRGAPQAELDQVSNTISSPYDRQLSNISQSDASRQASFAQQGSAAGNYYGQVQAALPALRNELAMKVATLQAQAARQQQAQQLALARAQVSASASADRASAAAAKAAKPETPGQILTDQFGGLTGFQNLVDQDNATLVPNYQNDFAGQRGGLAGPGNSVSDTEVGRSYADSIGQSAGLAPGIGAALYAPQQVRDANQARTDASAAQRQFNADNPDVVAVGRHVGLSTKGTQQMFDSPEYKSAVTLAELYAQQGKTLNDLKVALGSASDLKNKPKTREAILYQYGSQLPTPAVASAAGP